MKFISLLRGINVSGQKKVLMKDLKSLYEKLSLSHVVTYIQSGNVVFESEITNPNELAQIIFNAIKKQYGFDVPITIRSHQQLQKVVDYCPFKASVLKNEANKVVVFYLSEIPDLSRQTNLLSLVQVPEKLAINNTEIYLHSPNGFGKSKLTNNFIENKLKVQSTARNWKTTIKLAELSKA